MIKKLLISKITSTASAEFGVIGLKIVDTESFHHIGMFLAILGFIIFLVCLAVHAQHDAVGNAVPTTTKHNRSNRRSRASRTR